MKENTFFFDNNLSHKISKGFNEFGEKTTHLLDNFPPDTPDVEWIPNVASKNWVVISKDKNIKRRCNELQALLEHNLKMFVITSSEMKQWEIIKILVNKWEKIKRLSKEKPPFVFSIPSRGEIKKII